MDKDIKISQRELDNFIKANDARPDPMLVLKQIEKHQQTKIEEVTKTEKRLVDKDREYQSLSEKFRKLKLQFIVVSKNLITKVNESEEEYTKMQRQHNDLLFEYSKVNTKYDARKLETERKILNQKAELTDFIKREENFNETLKVILNDDTNSILTKQLLTLKNNSELSLINERKSFVEKITKMNEDKKVEVYEALHSMIQKYLNEKIRFSGSYAYEQLAIFIIDRLKHQKESMSKVKKNVARIYSS